MDEGQLVAIVAEPAQDPAPEAPSPCTAQKLVELPGPPLHINSWAEEMEEYNKEQGRLQEAVDEHEEELLKSDGEEEQQEQGDDYQELLQSTEASFHENEEMEEYKKEQGRLQEAVDEREDLPGSPMQVCTAEFSKEVCTEVSKEVCTDSSMEVCNEEVSQKVSTEEDSKE